MRKLAIFSLLSFLFLVPSVSSGIVPCSILDCTLCHFFQMLLNIVNFIYNIAIPIAVLMVAIGGLLMVVSYINPDAGGDLLTKARSVFKTVAIGLLIIYGSWLILDLLLSILGYGGWSSISC